MTDYKKWEQIEASIPEDEEDVARKRLREQKESMSEKEVRRLHECWEKPEFKAMFHEYAEEVSDPAHRAESEKYLAQCEAEQRAERDAKNGFLNGRSASEFTSLNSCVPGQPEGPEGAQLLKPHKGFVIKTWKKQPGRADFDRELGKCFINVCSHDDIDPPTAQDVTAPDGRKGQTWSLPHLCSPAVKDETDRAGHQCAVIDIVFNTEVLKRIEAPNGIGQRWKEMVANSALEMVAKLHQIELDVAGHKLLNTKYFGDTGEGPSTLSWKPAGAFEERELPTAKRSPKAQAEAMPPPATQQAVQPSPASADAIAPTGSGSSRGAVPTSGGASDPAHSTKAAPRAPSAPVRAAPPKKKTPKYSIVHRGVGDLGTAWNDAKLSSSGRPRELCVKLELPELSSAGDIDLDITERKLELTAEGAGYALSLPLPFPVLSDQGSAKFDKSKRVLSVTLPVAAATAPMPVWQPASKGQTDEERAAEEAEERAAEAAARVAAEAAEATEREAARAARAAKAKQEEEERLARKQAAILQAEREAAKRASKEAAASRRAAAVPKPAAPQPVAPPPPKPVREAEPKAEVRMQASPAAEAEKENEKEKESDWVEVSEAEAAAAKAASPPPSPLSTKPRVPPPVDEKKKVLEAEPPAAPTGKGLPALSNGLLFELD